jgi:hypothetical protein
MCSGDNDCGYKTEVKIGLLYRNDDALRCVVKIEGAQPYRRTAPKLTHTWVQTVFTQAKGFA